MRHWQNPDYQTKLRALFEQVPFVKDLGMTLWDVGSGWCETDLILQPKHMQQDSFVHAGVTATMADHTAGWAAWTSLHEWQRVLTVEFKINLLRPAQGKQLRCRSDVLKTGKTLVIVESQINLVEGEDSILVAKAMVTLVVVETPE